MDFLTLKKIMIVTKQSALKILEIEREYRKAVKLIQSQENLKELFRDDDKE